MQDIAKLRKMVRCLREVNPEFPMQQFGIFLEVCADPGVTQTELSSRFSMHSGTVSRNLKALGVYVENGTRKGADLIDLRPDLYERRKLGCHLTSKGKKLLEDLTRIMEENHVCGS